MEIKKVGVIGCGLMGSGIVHTSASAGFEVVVREVNHDFLDRGLGKIAAQMEKAVAKGKLEAQAMEDILSRITGTTELEELQDCDLIIEAVTENVELKQAVHRKPSSRAIRPPFPCESRRKSRIARTASWDFISSTPCR